MNASEEVGEGENSRFELGCIVTRFWVLRVIGFIQGAGPTRIAGTGIHLSVFFSV